MTPILPNKSQQIPTIPYLLFHPCSTHSSGLTSHNRWAPGRVRSSSHFQYCNSRSLGTEERWLFWWFLLIGFDIVSHETPMKLYETGIYFLKLKMNVEIWFWVPILWQFELKGSRKCWVRLSPSPKCNFVPEILVTGPRIEIPLLIQHSYGNHPFLIDES